MHRRQPLPRLWMMTDERQGEGLWSAIDRLPRGAGIVFRHRSLAARERRRLFERVKVIARRKRLVLLLAASPATARAWGADGSHGRLAIPATGLHSAPVHGLVEMKAAERRGASVLFVSPAFATRSHPGGRPLGRARFGLLVRQARLPVIALGGMNARRARGMAGFGIYGWAAIDAWGA